MLAWDGKHTSKQSLETYRIKTSDNVHPTTRQILTNSTGIQPKYIVCADASQKQDTNNLGFTLWNRQTKIGPKRHKVKTICDINTLELFGIYLALGYLKQNKKQQMAKTLTETDTSD